ncbi:2Fe-2S iron-sulfur cluster binding domain-containing protein [Aquibacillus halophilus]|uniref:2Fe-2S iron-sulfur cluster binding domain-containing protein n=1 Tax=Aquibacillus halophilus TaxID=930132 RepID=A0A6A8DFA6_9BACI|nr:(2Fe-2S)-binding protein [Aquibacillus halophilus]MRH44343.1 2Fe-2S iron-sulfur cluster binding domain-containing protein [Aquibacillus halophilus]
MGESRAVTVNQPTEDKTIDITVVINGKEQHLQTEPTKRLVDILRNDLDLTGTKISCGIGRCGACSVMINGNLINSCLVMAYQVDQASITTIEGIVREEGLDPIQTAFLEEGGFQCGYCTPGMVMAVKSLLADTPNPTEEQIKTALSGNLCRCTGYGGIIRAVQRVIEEGTYL